MDYELFAREMACLAISIVRHSPGKIESNFSHHFPDWCFFYFSAESCFSSPLITRAKRIACEHSERQHSRGARAKRAPAPRAKRGAARRLRSRAGIPASAGHERGERASRPEGEGRAARARAGRDGQARANPAGSRGSGGANYTTRCILYDCVSRKQPYKMRLSFVYIRAARPQDGGGRPG